MEQNKYLEYLAELYPTIEKASTEIINLQSIINLPKGTEHFLSDIHGEYEAFSHVLRNGSGAVRKKIDDVFGHTLGTAETRSVATLTYYPREELEQLRPSGEEIGRASCRERVGRERGKEWLSGRHRQQVEIR